METEKRAQKRGRKQEEAKIAFLRISLVYIERQGEVRSLSRGLVFGPSFMPREQTPSDESTLGLPLFFSGSCCWTRSKEIYFKDMRRWWRERRRKSRWCLSFFFASHNFLVVLNVQVMRCGEGITRDSSSSLFHPFGPEKRSIPKPEEFLLCVARMPFMAWPSSLTRWIGEKSNFSRSLHGAHGRFLLLALVGLRQHPILIMHSYAFKKLIFLSSSRILLLCSMNSWR